MTTSPKTFYFTFTSGSAPRMWLVYEHTISSELVRFTAFADQEPSKRIEVIIPLSSIAYMMIGDQSQYVM